MTPEQRTCRTCDEPLLKKPGPGRWPTSCDACRPQAKPTQVACATCGVVIQVVRRSGPAPKYCSRLCRSRASSDNKKRDGRYEADLQRKRDETAERYRQQPPRACDQCGDSFLPKQERSRFCSPKCNRDFHRDRDQPCTKPGCERPQRARGLCAMDWNRKYGKRTKYTITCITCGIEHQSDRPTGKYCSDWCKGAAYSLRGAGPHSKIPRTHPAHPQWQGRLLPVVSTPRRNKFQASGLLPLRKRWYVGQCRRCSAWFVFDQPANAYCSRRCGAGDSKDRRRARKRSAFVAAVYRRRIFERDGWRCQLCGKKTRRDKAVPNSLAPVLDHIIPLAQGGTHEPANVQCAHFLCNSIKGDRGGNEQLALIG